MRQEAKDDIVLSFRTADGSYGYTIRIASRHGEETMPRLISNLTPFMKPGTVVTGWVETPSRFAK